MQCAWLMLASLSVLMLTILTVAGVLAVGGFTLLSSAQTQQPSSAKAR